MVLTSLALWLKAAVAWRVMRFGTVKTKKVLSWTKPQRLWGLRGKGNGEDVKVRGGDAQISRLLQS